MNKPEEIRELEKIYGIVLRESADDVSKINSYKLDEKQEIIGLNLSNNRLTDIKDLENLTQLKTLNLSGNLLVDIKVLEKLTQLQTLSLSNNQLTDIKVLEKLMQLQSLSLSNNQLSDIKALENLTLLQSLFLSNNQLSDIKGLEKLTLLRWLYLDNNQLSDIKVLEKLTQLHLLYLSNNQLSDIKVLEKLTLLKWLYLDNNQLSDIKALENLTLLQSLYLSINQLSDIKVLEKLTLLKWLYLDNNQLSDIKALENLTLLQSLYLSINQLSDIKALENLTLLQSLDLFINRLTDIKVLENLTLLQSLNLSGNQLTDIKVLENLTLLETLGLSYNQLTDIKALENLPLLKALDLSNNQLNFSEMQPFVYSLENILKIETLQYLSIDNNLFPKDFPVLVKNENHLSGIKKYFSDNKLNKVDILLPVKIMFLGNHAAGKTSLLHYLSNDTTKPICTHVLNIKFCGIPENEHVFQAKDPSKLPDVTIYDFGGHDYYHGLYQAFFSEDAINLILWCKESDQNKIRETEDSTEEEIYYTRDFSRRYWLYQLDYASKILHRQNTETQKNNYTRPVLMIQTHADKDDNERNNYTESYSKHNILNEFYISLEPETMEDYTFELQYFKDFIFREIKNKHIKTQKPEYYQIFLNDMVLKYDKAECISLNELLNSYTGQESEEYNFSKLDSLKEDLYDLHNKGLVLYYKNNEKLNDVVWLNPTKTVEFIHNKILSHEYIKKGTVPENKFIEILNENNQKKLKELLIAQKVIFYDFTDVSNKKYIIPGYLPLSEKDEYAKILQFGFEKPNFVLKFMNFIPFGLINQLICLYGVQPDFKKFWRDRLIFTFNKSYMVMIALDFSNLKIEVHIRPKDILDEDRYPSLKQMEKLIFFNIIDLYNREDIDNPKYLRIKQNIRLDNNNLEFDGENISFKDKDSIDKYLDRTQIDSPEDLYISVDGNYFADYCDLNKPNDTHKFLQNTINTCKIDTKTQCINKNDCIVQSVYCYKNFTNNNISNMKKIFISYSSIDEEYKNDFILHTKTMQDNRLIEKPFACSNIELGADWDETVKKELNDCDFMICLVSKYFLNSDYTRRVEVTNAMNQKKKLIPIIIRPCDWKGSDFAIFQAAYKGQCISLDAQNTLAENTGIERDACWLKIITEMREKLF